MNILKKVVKKDIFLNKKRTLGIIIGIILASFLITIVSSLFITFQNSVIETSINETGYYHIELSNLTKEDVKNIKFNKDFSNKVFISDLGFYSTNSNEHVYSMSKDTFDCLQFKLVEGTFPKNKNEILIRKDMTDYKIGDVITLSIGESIADISGNPISTYYFGERYLSNAKDYTFKVVGFIVSSKNVYITNSIDSNKYVAYLTLSNPYHYQKDFSELLGVKFDSFNNRGTKGDNEVKYDYLVNENIISWEVFGYNINLKLIYSLFIVIVLIILIISVFSIRNSFAISVVEKTRVYAILKSVGSTNKQIRKMVLLEGLYLGLIGSPIGIILGTIFSFILTKVISYIIVTYIIDYSLVLYYKFSIYPIIFSILFSIIMIYISTYLSAKKASDIAPIENIRNAQEFNSKKKIKVPKIISKIFKIGGAVSYKYLKLDTKKYRVTVISLVISIFSFITFSSFVDYSFKEVRSSFPDLGYNIAVSFSNLDGKTIDKLSKLENNFIKYRIPSKNAAYMMPNNHITYNGLAHETCKYNEQDSCQEKMKVVFVDFNIIDDASFKEYAKKIKVKYDDVKDKVIILNETKNLISNRPVQYAFYTLTNYKYGDDLILKFLDSTEELNLKVGAVTNVRMYGYQGNYNESLVIFVNEKYVNNSEAIAIYYNSKNASKLEKEIKNIALDANIENNDKEVKSNSAVILIISIVIYGFIGIVTFIGLTSVFNTITSNMHQRSRELAMLKSVGMTKREFNNMILLESVFYSFKSLLYGVILGIIGSYVVYKIFTENVNYTYSLPIKAIIISNIFIVIIVYMIMNYSVKKINKQNVIETIRKDII